MGSPFGLASPFARAPGARNIRAIHGVALSLLAIGCADVRFGGPSAQFARGTIPSVTYGFLHEPQFWLACRNMPRSGTRCRADGPL
jgi:hypothetical protein